MDAVRRARFIPPVRPDGMSDEDFFGLFFNQYDRVPEMTAETQVNLLFRFCGLVALSNRRPGADLDLLTNQGMPFIRNRSGVAWHPIFISTDQFDVEDEEEEGGTKSWEDLECDAASAARKKVSLDSPRKNLLVPLHHIADLMVHNHILSLDKEHQVKRNPTYPANFRHGDILCLAVLPKKDGETLIDWYRNDGTYIWLETTAHPRGFPILWEIVSMSTVTSQPSSPSTHFRKLTDASFFQTVISLWLTTTTSAFPTKGPFRRSFPTSNGRTFDRFNSSSLTIMTTLIWLS